LDDLSALTVFYSICISAPIIETLLCQLIPIEIARLAKASKTWQLLPSVTLFAAAHFYVSTITSITAGLICGFYFAFAYIRNREISIVRAFLTTAAIHSGINLITFAAFLLRPYGIVF